MIQVVIDTNVLVAGLYSRTGASYKLLSLIDRGYFEINLSVPLVVEYEGVLQRHQAELGLNPLDLANFLNYLCGVANLHEIYFLWRPYLKDPKDEMVLELAIKGRCTYILTYNLRDFRGAELFGIQVITPKQFLQNLGIFP